MTAYTDRTWCSKEQIVRTWRWPTMRIVIKISRKCERSAARFKSFKTNELHKFLPRNKTPSHTKINIFARPHLNFLPKNENAFLCVFLGQRLILPISLFSQNSTNKTMFFFRSSPFFLFVPIFFTQNFLIIFDTLPNCLKT